MMPRLILIPVLLLAAACATSDNAASSASPAPTSITEPSRPPPAPSPPVIAPPPQKGEPAKPVKGASVAKPPVVVAASKAAATTAPAATTPAVPKLAAASAPTLDLRTLEQRLKSTPAIGVMTKLSLKNQVDDLVGDFRSFHNGRRPPTLPELRPSYELLMMKVLALLQDKDAALAKDINASREAIWSVLADRDKLAAYA